MTEPVFILRSRSGSKLLTFPSLPDALRYRERVQTDGARFDIIRQTIIEERVA